MGSLVYVGYVVASGGLGFLIGKFNWFGLLCIIGVCWRCGNRWDLVEGGEGLKN